MKLDIILTVYNIEKDYLSECLESIYSQTFQDFRIIVIDDCSTNDYSYLKNMDKIHYIRNEENIGMCKSVNKAFSIVNSEYCVRLGSDDKFNSSLLCRESSFLDYHDDYIAVCCEFQNFGNRNDTISRPKIWNLNLAKKGTDYGFAGGMMFRSCVLDKIKIDESFPICEDFEFHTQLMKLGKIHAIHEPLYYYRRHENQTVSKISRDKIKYYQKIIRDRIENFLN